MMNQIPIDLNRFALWQAIFETCPPPKMEPDPGWELAIPAIAATEAVLLNKDGEYDTIVMSGCQFPKVRQIPLCYNHSDKNDLDHIIGSFRRMGIVGDRLVGITCFHTTETATRLYALCKNGHIRSVSIRFVICDSIRLRPRESVEWDGRTYKARCGKPLNVITNWSPIELSVTERPSDPSAGFVYDAPAWAAYPTISSMEPNPAGPVVFKDDSSSGGDQK